MAKSEFWALKVQFAFYLVEALLVAGLLGITGSDSPQFALGPLARILVAAALPLPCHLLWLAHFLSLGDRLRPRLVSPLPALRPFPWTPPVPAAAPCGVWIDSKDVGKQIQPSVAG